MPPLFRFRRPRKCLVKVLLLGTALALGVLPARMAHGQQLTLLGLRSQNAAGQFNGLKADASGNLYTLLDANNGVRLLKFDPTGTTLLAQTQLGSAGDQGVALALDTAGNIYVAGTSMSNGSVTGTTGAAYPARSGSTVNSFLVKFSPALVEQWLTFLGSGKMAVAAVDVSSGQVVVTGGVFSATLPVTNNAIQTSPLPGSTGDGFVQGYNTADGTLNYSTYLTGANGDTQPSSVALDSAGNTYVAGTTSATGFPTVNAMVPIYLSDSANGTSGFLAKLTPAGDAFLFSTYVPGNGIASAAYDSGTGTVLLSGDIARGLFPVTVVSGPIASNAAYQSAVRVAADGSNVVASTLLAPSTVSVVAPAPAGLAVAVSAANATTLPLLPLAPAQTMGTAAVLQLDSKGTPIRDARIGGIVTRYNGYSSLPALATGVVGAADGSATVGGGVAPTVSSSLLTSQRFDMPLVNAPTGGLPNTLRDAAPAACTTSQCTGGAGLLARMLASTSPQLALSLDNLPNITLRNLGSTDATGVALSLTVYTDQTNCTSTLPAGGECEIALYGSGPGTLTVRSGNDATITATLPASTAFASAIVVSPKELDFGVDSAVSTARTRTLTITNLGFSQQTFASRLTSIAQAYTIAESASDCVPVGNGTSKTLAPNSTCHITLSLTASADATNDGAINAAWTIGTREVLLTGYVQAAALSVSATHIGFGRQYNGGLRVPRYLYLSNGSDLQQSHAAVSLPSNSPFTVTDGCPATLAPQSVCRMTIGYNSLMFPSADSTTLTLDSGLSVLIDGETLPAPTITGAGGADAASLSVTPTSITFANAVVATTVGSETQTVAIKNTGTSSFALTTAVSGDFTASTCPPTLAGGATCTVTIQFAPSDSGTRQGLLSVAAGTASPVYVTLSGQGTPFLTTTNGTIAFGEVPVGVPTTRWFKVGRPFPSLTVSTASANFGVVIVEDQGFGYGQPDRNSFQQSVTHSCSSCYVGVQFLPTETGPLTATMTLQTTAGGSNETTALTGTGRPTTGVILSPSVQAFGSVDVGSITAPTTFVLTNATGAPLTTAAPTVSGGDFALSTGSTGGTACGATLANGESCTAAVQFQPGTVGNRVGQLTVQTGSGAAAAALSGVATGSTGLSFAPNALVFANVPGTGATALTTTLTNTAANAVVIGTPASSDPHFSATTNCTTLQPGASCTITVQYTPTAALAAGQLTVPVTSSGSGTAQTTSFELALTGKYTTETAGLQIVPGEDAAVHFGALATGSVSPARVLRVNNLSGKSLTITTQLPRQFPLVASTCGALAPGASCTLSVVYAPLTNADVLGTLYVQGTPTDGTATLNGLGYLEGYGLSANSLVASGNFSPTGVLDFGQVSSGASATQTVTLTNKAAAGSAGAPITVRRVHVDAPFQTSTTCGAALPVNASCTVKITYAPSVQVATGTTDVSTQNAAGVVTVEADAENAPLLLDVTGNSVAVQSSSPTNAAPLSVLALSQGALTFQTTAVGTASASQAVTVSNAGTTTIHIGGVVPSADFTVSGSCGTLNPGDSCTLQVAFTPQLAGTRSGALEIQSDAAQSLEFVSLLGTGTPASVSLTPATLNFGSLLLGRNTTRTATFANNGSSPVTVQALATTGDFAIASATTATTPCTAGLVLQPGTACTVDVVFSPTQTGSRNGTLTVASNATAIPLSVALSGIGVVPQLVATPNGLAFGVVQIGKSAALSLTLANTSTTDVNQLVFGITGDFSAVSTCGPGTLRAGSSCAVTVSFTPTIAGTRTGVLSISSSDPSSPLLIPLSGGASQGGAFTLTANGASTATASERVAIPATYALAVTPTGGFTGAVALTCTPQGAYAYITCSITPSSVTLGNGTQTATATITTVTGAATASLAPASLVPSRASRASALAACLLAPCVLLVRRRRVLRIPLLLLLCSVVLMGASGCGSGVGDTRIRYGAAGNYQFIVTASSTTGVTTSQSVTLNLTITP